MSERMGYAFGEGVEYRAFRYLGCHSERGGYVFRVFAPNAERAFVTGEFNGWSDSCPMTLIRGTGIWESFVPADEMEIGSLYKYKFLFRGQEIYKADPFGAYSGVYPETASRVYPLGEYEWHDSAWLAQRKKKYSNNGARKNPVNIYEIHIPSCKRAPDGGVMSYSRLADDLAPYLLQMGYTHVEVMEPFGTVDGKKTSFVAPDSTFGTPREFKEFVDIMHRAGIGVILDWDILSFSDAEHSLSMFDGTALFEKGGTQRFDPAERAVQSFLISNAVYLCEVFHIDGLMLENLSAVITDARGVPDRASVTLVRRINGVLKDYFPDVVTIADDIRGSLAVTSDAASGLGFTFKWDSVCTADTLGYAQVPLNERAQHTSELSAPLKHAFGEASVLTLAHTDVTDGRRSFMAMLPGSYDEKFAQNRVFFTYMMTRPGKKLRFMGSEIGQFDEWDRNGEVQWFLLDFVKHAQLQLYLAKLGELYLKTPALWEYDCEPRGFSLDAAQGGVFSYRRFDSKGGELAVVLNFSPYRICKYSVGVTHGGTWEEVLSSDSTLYGGSGVENGTVEAVQKRSAGFSHSLTVDLPPLGAVVLKYIK